MQYGSGIKHQVGDTSTAQCPPLNRKVVRSIDSRGVEPAVRIRIFVTQFSVQNHFKTKLPVKQVLMVGCSKKPPSLIVR